MLPLWIIFPQPDTLLIFSVDQMVLIVVMVISECIKSYTLFKALKMFPDVHWWSLPPAPPCSCPILSNHWSVFLSLNIFLHSLGFSIKGMILCILLGLVFFPRIMLCASILCVATAHPFSLLNSIPLYGYPSLIYLFTSLWTLDCLQFFAIANKASVNSSASLCMDIYLPFSYVNIKEWNGWIIWWVCV